MKHLREFLLRTHANEARGLGNLDDGDRLLQRTRRIGVARIAILAATARAFRGVERRTRKCAIALARVIGIVTPNLPDRSVATPGHFTQTLPYVVGSRPDAWNPACDTLNEMSAAARKLLQDALALPEDERVEVASEIIASLDGPADADWNEAWVAELDRRMDAAKARGQATVDWADARARILQRLGPK